MDYYGVKQQLLPLCCDWTFREHSPHCRKGRRPPSGRKAPFWDPLISVFVFLRLSGEVRCEPPNNRLDKFKGTLSVNGQTYALDNDKVLLRGCTLRNTGWCYGLVVFGGKQTNTQTKDSCCSTLGSRPHMGHDEYLSCSSERYSIFLGSAEIYEFKMGSKVKHWSSFVLYLYVTDLC